MKRVLLLSPPFLPDYMRNARCDFVSLSKTQWYPIWLGYCGAFLEDKGYDVRLIDAPAYGLNHTQSERAILEYNPDMILFYTGLMSEDNDIEFADRIVNKLDCDAVFVGPFTSVNPERLLKKSKSVNKAIESEFEYPVLEILEGKNSEDISNLHYKENNEIKRNECRPYLNREQLDNIPFVTRFFKKHLDFKYYRAVAEYHPFVDIFSGRGCKWGLCTYCLWVFSFIKGQTYNTRSPENVAEEFGFVSKEVPEIRSIMIQDDTFTEEHANELCPILIKKKNRLPWSCYSRANLSYDTLVLMKHSGCRNLHVGYESANPVILTSSMKGITVKTMTAFTKNAKKVGLRIHGDFVIGLNGDDVNGIKKTIKWAKELSPDTAQFQLMIPYESTPFYNYCASHGYIKEGKPDYPELPKEDLERWVRYAYRQYYLSFFYMKKVLMDPKNHLFPHLKIIHKAIPAMLWGGGCPG